MRAESKKIVFVIVSILCLVSMTFADWNSGDPYKMHFPQLPNPDGWDICLHEQMIADDFLCTETGPITDIHFWVSWQSDMEDWLNTTFTVQIWSNLPGGPCGGGMPGMPLWTWNGGGNFVVRQPPETGVQGWHCPATQLTLWPDHLLYWQINITNIPLPFVQQAGTTYWLVIRANKPDWPPAVGWKTSLNRFQSCSLWSAGAAAWQPVLAGTETVDQAFVITSSTPEPNEPEPNIPNSKYIQPPDLTPNGIDIRLDDADGVTRHIADDFPCNTPGPITDVHFWGSWKDDLKGNIIALIVSIYDDNSLPPYSRPKTLLWQHKYMAGDFNETLYKDLTPEYEWWWDPFFHDLVQYGDHQVWKYDIKIDPRMAFRQDGNTTNPKVYWLELQAWLPYGQTYKFGWKTSRQHWNDDAVFANGSNPPYMWHEMKYPLGHPYYELPPDKNSIDMAFAVTTGAEPNIPTDPNVKFKQPPDESALGIDIRCDRQDMLPRTLADDFVCFERGAITDVHLWGSWLGEPNMKGEVNSIHLSIHSDIPSWQNPYGDWSTPGPVLWQRDIQVGDFKETLYKTMTYYEGWWDPSLGISSGYLPNGDRQIWQYDIVIPPSAAFIQQGEPNKPKIYWLDVYVQLKNTVPTAQFGWKTSTEHFNDNAVYFDTTTGQWKPMSYPEQHPQMGKPIDMAFSITNKKECIKPWATEYARWVTYRKPDCWCCKRNCRGDADCVSTLGKPVANPDLSILKGGFNKAASVVRDLIVGGKPAICADFDRKDTLGKPVANPDLTILKLYFNKALTQVPCCDLDQNCILAPADVYLFWTN